MRVGLVLGAGGVLGGAWLTGALDAIADETGWDPGSAEYVVGTSAGSMIGALLAAGVPPWFMVAHSRGELFEGLSGPDGRPAADADRSGGAVFRLHRGLPSIGPGSLRMAFTSLSNPLRHTPLQLLAGWLPAGLISTDALKEIVQRAVPGDWVEHPGYWAVACDYESGPCRSAACALRGRSWPTPWLRHAPSPASTARCESAGAATSTVASARCRTSTSWLGAASTW